ncbi:hypothetical protein C0993_008850 [Termitomyces sp. T159_Od127]|nr:hypothetical protein C0993_008850 [Termitomyces sp. T159_Od127]
MAKGSEFVGLSADALPEAEFLADAEGLEFDMWIVFEEEPSTIAKMKSKHNTIMLNTEDYRLALLCEDQTLKPVRATSRSCSSIT